MTLKEAIKRADDLRPNALEPELKATWIYELEGQISEMMDMPCPLNVFPKDAELLMPAPYDNIYYLYAAAMIDFAMQDSQMYDNDMAMFNAALSEAKMWYRRSNTPKNQGNWRVM